MSIKKFDFVFLFLAIGLAGLGILAIGTHDAKLGLYSLLGLFGVGFTMAILINPILGVNILVIAIYTNISDLMTDNGYPGIIKPLVALVFVAILVHNLYSRQVYKGGDKTARIQIFLFLYFIAVTTSFVTATDKSVASQAIFDLAKDMAIIYCLLFTLVQENLWKSTAWVLIITTGIICIIGIFQIITNNITLNSGLYSLVYFGLASVKYDISSGGSDAYRISGPVHDPNMWAQILVAVVPLVVYRVIYEHNRFIKVFALGILGLILYSIIDSYSRGAYLGLVVVTLLILIERRVNFMAAFFGLALTAIAITALPPTYLQRIQSLVLLSPTDQNGIYQDQSFRGRASEMLTGLSMFSSHPLLGVGAGNYILNYQQYAQAIGIEVRPDPREAHSLYIQKLAENGIIGATAFFGMIFTLLGVLVKTRKTILDSPAFSDWLPWINALLISIVGYLVCALFLHDAYIRYFWILAALAIAAIKLTDEMVRAQRKPLE